MNGIRLMTIITKREYESAYVEFLKKDGLTAIFGTPCQGTAGMNVLNLLGLEQTEKALMVAMAERRLAEKLMSRMVSQLGIDMPAMA